MSEDIQGLLDRIQSDGIEKAEAEKKRILDAAKQEAAEIITKARTEAAGIIKEAEESAAISESKGNAAVKQAARDVILSLQSDLQKRLENLVRESIGQSMTPELMGKIILLMSEKYITENQNSELEVLLSAGDAAKMETALKAGLLSNLKNHPVIKISNSLASGLKIGVKGTDLFFDFSDDALTDVICSYAGPKISAVMKD